MPNECGTSRRMKASRRIFSGEINRFIRKHRNLKGKAWEDGDQKVYIDYHLDKFFVPQHAGKEIEQAATKGRAAAVVKIYRGRAVITNLVTE